MSARKELPTSTVALMEVTEPCIMCDPSAQCSCRNSLERFFNLFQGVQERLLRVKAASPQNPFQVLSAGIDKLDAYLLMPIDMHEVVKHYPFHGLNYRSSTLKKLRCIVVENGEFRIHLKTDHTLNKVTGWISNPNQFKSWRDYINFLEKVVPIERIRTAKVSRLDLNLDFKCSLTQLIQSLNVKNKSVSHSFTDKGGIRTGLIIGKNPGSFTIYDKALKTSTLSPHSRIELRLSKNRLPTKSTYEIPSLLVSTAFFEELEGLSVTFPDTAHPERLLKFKSIFERDGFYAARKAMSITRNFDRDLARHLKIEQWASQPSNLFKSEIKKFLEGEEAGHSPFIH